MAFTRFFLTKTRICTQKNPKSIYSHNEKKTDCFSFLYSSSGRKRIILQVNIISSFASRIYFCSAGAPPPKKPHFTSQVKRENYL